MQTETFAERFTLESQSDGNNRTLLFNPSNAALNAKTLTVFLEIIEVDTDTKIWVEYEDSADGVAWNAFAQTLIDTAGPSQDQDATVGVISGSSTSEFGAWVRLKVTTEQRSTTRIRRRPS